MDILRALPVVLATLGVVACDNPAPLETKPEAQPPPRIPGIWSVDPDWEITALTPNRDSRTLVIISQPRNGDPDRRLVTFEAGGKNRVIATVSLETGGYGIASDGESVFAVGRTSMERFDMTSGVSLCRLSLGSGNGGRVGIDRDGTVYLVTTNNLFRVNPACVVTATASSGGLSLHELAVDGGQIYVGGSDASGCYAFVRRYDPDLKELWTRQTSDTGVFACVLPTHTARGFVATNSDGNLVLLGGDFLRCCGPGGTSTRFGYLKSVDTAGVLLHPDQVLPGTTPIVPVAADSSGAAYVLEGSSLVKRGNWRVSRSGYLGALLGDTVFVASGAELFLYDARTGKVIY